MSFQTEESLWVQVLDRLENMLEPQVCEHWFSHVSFNGFDGERMILSVPNEFFLSWLRERYGEVLDNAIREVFHKEISINFCIQPENEAKTGIRKEIVKPVKELSEEPIARKNHKPSNGLRLNPNYTFENFVVGHGNEFAYAAAKAVSESPGRNYNPLFIYGMTGLGKTHLMQGIGHQLLRRDSSKKVMYVTSEEFTNELIMSISEGSQSRFREKYRKVDILLIDDIHFIAEKEATQIEFFHT
ncbi:MAG: DnaA ATPase domain-containing protein, partial [Candidatus Hydrogenedens sp.]